MLAARSAIQRTINLATGRGVRHEVDKKQEADREREGERTGQSEACGAAASASIWQDVKRAFMRLLGIAVWRAAERGVAQPCGKLRERGAFVICL